MLMNSTRWKKSGEILQEIQLFSVVLTISSTSASVECIFSCLKTLKLLQGTQYHSADLTSVVISIHRELFEKIDESNFLIRQLRACILDFVVLCFSAVSNIKIWKTSLVLIWIIICKNWQTWFFIDIWTMYKAIILYCFRFYVLLNEW